MIHLRLPSLPKLVLFVVGMLLVVDCLAEKDTKTHADKDKGKSKKKKSKDKNKKSKAEGTDADDEKDVEGDAVVDE